MKLVVVVRRGRRSRRNRTENLMLVIQRYTWQGGGGEVLEENDEEVYEGKGHTGGGKENKKADHLFECHLRISYSNCPCVSSL